MEVFERQALVRGREGRAGRTVLWADMVVVVNLTPPLTAGMWPSRLESDLSRAMRNDPLPRCVGFANAWGAPPGSLAHKHT